MTNPLIALLDLDIQVSMDIMTDAVDDQALELDMAKRIRAITVVKAKIQSRKALTSDERNMIDYLIDTHIKSQIE